MRRRRRPGIHRAAIREEEWIPGSRSARPGMTENFSDTRIVSDAPSHSRDGNPRERFRNRCPSREQRAQGMPGVRRTRRCPGSDIRMASRWALLRMSEPKGHLPNIEFWCGFGFDIRMEGFAAALMRMSNPPHQPRVQQKKHTSWSPQVRRNIPAFPARWFYGFLCGSPGDRAFLPPSPAERESILAELIPASRYQDATTSPSASRLRSSCAGGTRPPLPASPTFVTIAKRPS
jgi:hypothetical protein